jgi:hypothetical protein
MMMRHDKRDDARDVGFPSGTATCDDVRAVAWSYLDDELPRAERRSIRTHLMYCDHCGAYLQFLRGFLRTLRTELTRAYLDDQEPST